MADSAAESALSFLLTPMGLGIQHKISNFKAELNKLKSSFTSPGPVANPWLKSTVWPTIYSKLEGEYFDSYISQGY